MGSHTFNRIGKDSADDPGRELPRRDEELVDGDEAAPAVRGARLADVDRHARAREPDSHTHDHPSDEQNDCEKKHISLSSYMICLMSLLTLSAGEAHDEGPDGEDDAGPEDGGLAAPAVRDVAAEDGAGERRRDCPGHDQLVPDRGETKILKYET